MADECNIFFVPKVNTEVNGTPTILVEKAILWHTILGHIEEKGLCVLHNKGMVEGIYSLSLEFDVCEHFVYHKHNWVKFLFSMQLGA